MKIKVAKYIADWCKEKGMHHVFTVTGGGAMHLNDAFGNHPDITCTYNHHEQACAIAAEGYYRVAGSLPVVCVTTGPGGTNAITGVVGAWLDSIPMFVISGQVKFDCTIKSMPELGLRQFGDQEFNITDMMKTATKYAVMVDDANTIKYHLERALFLATHGRPGPVWVDVPLNIQASTIETEQLVEYDPIVDDHILPPVINQDQIKEVINKIQNAKRPAIIAGHGVWLSKSKNEFDVMVNQLNIPVMTAWNSHDLISSDHPLFAGRPGTIGTRGGNFVFQNCDCLIVLGCRMNLRQVGYAWDQVAPNAYKIMIDIDPAEMKKKSFPVDMAIHGDCLDFIKQMNNTGYTKKSVDNDEWISWCKNINHKYSVTDNLAPGDGLNPYVFFEKISELIHEDQIMISSNGASCVIPFQSTRTKKGQRLFTNSGCASMGYGLPAAIGGSVAAEGKIVICFEGDGSLQMNLQELQTVTHNKLPLKIFVINNNGYHSIRQTQVNFFASKFAGVDPVTGISFPKLEKVANVYDMKYYCIDSEAEIAEVFSKIMEDNKPVICELVVNSSQNFLPKSSSKILPDGRMVSAPLHDMFPFLSDDEMRENMICGDEQ